MPERNKVSNSEPTDHESEEHPHSNTGMTLKHRIEKTLRAYGLSQIIYFSVQLISVPVMIQVWGKNVLAEWLLLSTIPSYLTIADMGFGQALGNELAIRWARDERDEGLISYQSGFWIVLISCFVFALLFSLFVTFAPIYRLFHLGSLSKEQSQRILIVLMVQVLLAQLQGVIRAAYRTHGLSYLSANINNIVQICTLIGVMSIVLFSITPLGLACVNCLITGAGNLLFYLYARKEVKWLYLGTSHVSMRRVKELLLPSLTINLFSIGSALNLQGIFTILTLVAGPQVALVFSSTRTMTRFVNQLTNMIESSFLPEFGPAMSSGNLETARMLHRRSSQLSLWTGILASGLLLLFSKPLFEVWTRNRLSYDLQLTCVLLLAIIVNGGYYGSTAVLLAENKHMKFSYFFIAVSVLALPITFGLVILKGALGAAIGVLAIEVAIYLYVVPAALTGIGDNLRDWSLVTFVPDFKWLIKNLRRSAL